MPFTPDSLRIAMVETQSKPEPEPKLTHKIRQSSRPGFRSHTIADIYLLNRSDDAVIVEVATGGYFSEDDRLQILSGRTHTGKPPPSPRPTLSCGRVRVGLGGPHVQSLSLASHRGRRPSLPRSC